MDQLRAVRHTTGILPCSVKTKTLQNAANHLWICSGFAMHSRWICSDSATSLWWLCGESGTDSPSRCSVFSAIQRKND